MKIENIDWSVSTSGVEALEAYVRYILFACGIHPDTAWVSDESHIGDFKYTAGRWTYWDGDREVKIPGNVREAWCSGQHNKRLLARIRRAVGMPVVWRCSIVEIARRLKESENIGA